MLTPTPTPTPPTPTPCPSCRHRPHGCRCRRRALAGGPADWTADAQLERVLARDGWLCPVCDRYINPRLRPPEPGAACLDRIRPAAAGGRGNEWNLRATHLACAGRPSR